MLVDDRNVFEPMTIEDCADAMQEMCAYALGIEVDADLIKQHIAHLSCQVELSMFMAKTLLRCNFISELIGASLRDSLRQQLHAFQFQLEPSATPNNTELVVSELLAAKKDLAELKCMAGNPIICN